MTNKTLEVFLGLAAAIPEDVALRELEMSIQNYRANKTRGHQDKLLMSCQMVCSKIAIDQDGLSKVLSQTQDLSDTHQKIKNAGSN